MILLPDQKENLVLLVSPDKMVFLDFLVLKEILGNLVIQVAQV